MQERYEVRLQRAIDHKRGRGWIGVFPDAVDLIRRMLTVQSASVAAQELVAVFGEEVSANTLRNVLARHDETNSLPRRTAA